MLVIFYYSKLDEEIIDKFIVVEYCIRSILNDIKLSYCFYLRRNKLS